LGQPRGFFSFGKKAGEDGIGGQLAELIATLPNSIQLEGHTDSIPIHNARFKSNWELSCARAIAVLETFCGTFELSRQRFSVVGRADTVPIDSNESPEGRARNRRVRFPNCPRNGSIRGDTGPFAREDGASRVLFFMTSMPSSARHDCAVPQSNALYCSRRDEY